MRARPLTKSMKKARFSRCPKCQRQIRAHQKRCKICSQKLKV